ncbi:MAG: putative rane protein [Chitinophagaceae bacterium]|nr:putative rane protein [Chitinophagaceae bacterium]
MKKLLVSAALGLVLTATAQQRPHYTQYILNNYIINPAVAGIENYTDVKLSHRHQWVGLDGAPVTTYVTIHGPLTKSSYERETPTTFHAPGENPRGKAYWQDYTAADPHHGIGFTMLNDRTGPLNRFSVAATYAYHLGISERTSLSAGLSAGVQNMTLNASKLVWGDVQVDPAVAGSGYLNKLRPDISAGLWMYSSNYFVGLAAQNIIPSKLSFAEDTVKLAGGKLVPHLFLSAGYRMFLNDDISLLPSATIRYINPMPIGVDLNAKLQYQDLLWGGLSYRLQDGFSAMVGLNMNSTMNVGYAYDYTTSRLNLVSKGSHEIVIGFLLGNKYGDWCPRNIW